MSTFAQRLQLFIDHEGLTTHLFNKQCGFTKGLIAKALQHDGMTTTSLQQILATFPNLNVDWLITGRGHMLLVDDEGVAHTVKPRLKKTADGLQPMPRDLEDSLYRQIVWHVMLQDGGYHGMHDRLVQIIQGLTQTRERAQGLYDQLIKIQQMVEMQYQVQPQDHGLYEMTLQIAVSADGKYTPQQLKDISEIESRLRMFLNGKGQ